jgi:hypothetical protein
MMAVAGMKVALVHDFEVLGVECFAQPRFKLG